MLSNILTKLYNILPLKIKIPYAYKWLLQFVANGPQPKKAYPS